MKDRTLLPVAIGLLLLPLGCGDDPIGPFATLAVVTVSVPNAGRTLAYSARTPSLRRRRW